MSSEVDKFGELFDRKLAGVRQAQLRFATCKKVDWDNRSMTAVGVSDGVDFHNVQLGFGYTDIKPAKGTLCLIGVLEGKDTLTFLINAEEVELVEINARKIIYNTGENDGLVKVREVAQKLNVIESDVNNLKAALAGWMPTIPVPTVADIASLKTAVATWSSQTLAATRKEELENNQITH